MHVHGLSAFVWMLLLAAQSWTIQNRHRDIHRLLGYGSFALFPIVLAGMGFLDVSMAQRFAAGSSSFHINYGARFGATDVVAEIGMGYFYFMALRERKNVRIHSGYMIMTIVFLVGTIINRSISDFVDLLLGSTVDIPTSMAVRVACAAVIGSLLIVRHYAASDTRPMRDAALFIGLQLVVWETIGIWSVWKQFFALFAQINPFVIGGAGFLFGVVVTISGWRTGSKSQQTAFKVPASFPS